MDFDSALEHIGGFGRHQIRIYFIVSLISLPLSAQVLIVVFVGAVPEWKCPSPEGDILHCNSSHARYIHTYIALFVNAGWQMGSQRLMWTCLYNYNILRFKIQIKLVNK